MSPDPSLRIGKYTHLACDDQDAPIEVAELLKIGRDVENLFGYPQDIEWVYLDGIFYLVQSQDITTLNAGSMAEQARQKNGSDFLMHMALQNVMARF